MSQEQAPQVYLISPPSFDPQAFCAVLETIFAQTPIACVRLAISAHSEDQIIRMCDPVRELAHRHDVPLVLDEHYMLAERLGLDGVHLDDGAKTVAAARKALGEDAIIGSFCGTSRHEGMSAGERGADYVALGPIGANNLGDGRQVERDVFEWWSATIELPIVAQGALYPEGIASFAPITDFFAIGAEIWDHEDPAAELARLCAAISAT